MPSDGPDNSIDQALDKVFADFINLYPDTPPQIEYDPDWPSPCYQHTAETGELVPWQPQRQLEPHDLFSGLAAALETPIHPDIVSYYSRYWSEPIPACFNDDDLSLIFIWNEQDYERLRSNIIGHALTQKRRKLPLTIFFACTEPEDFILSIDNSSGCVILEQPGQPRIREIAPSLTEFLQALTPRRID